MYQPLSLRKNFVWAFVGNVVSAFCMWLLLVVLTKLAPVETVGVFAVAQAVSLPISRFLGLQLTIVQITDAQNDYRFGHYYTVKFVAGILAVSICVAAGFLFYSFETALVITFLSAGYAVIEVRKVFLAVMQKFERMDKVAVSQIFLGTLSLLFFGAIFWASRNLVFSVIGLVCARLIVVFLYDNPTTSKFLSSSMINSKADSIKVIWAKKILWRLVRTAIPLGLVGWLGILFTSIPRLVLDKHFGKAEVGYFAALSSLLVVGTMVIAALSQAVTPRLAKYYFENLISYKLLLGKLFGIGAILGLCGIAISSLFGKWILTWMFRADYAEHNIIFIWITIAGALLFAFTFMNCGLNAARKFKVQVPIYGLSAAVCGFFSLLLIPHHGMLGAVWAVMACYGFGLLSSVAFVIMAVREKTSSSRKGEY